MFEKFEVLIKKINHITFHITAETNAQFSKNFHIYIQKISEKFIWLINRNIIYK